ncbi:hypothetical protein EDC04DRAFT_2610306 [Pisolithus marmoratus]|nr:hypothetical protein EDC04DRAFT_2612050 [Pisolithus marmoratus]KAI6010160.1 hypothetical protein EDC04DRAFT_2610306 [Pisolithus marmoratus]
MSQNIASTALPTPATTQDWSIVLDKAIQSASDDDKETTDAKYAEHQCQNTVKSTMSRGGPRDEQVVQDTGSGQAGNECTSRGQAGNKCASASRVRGSQAGREFKSKGEG